MNTQTMWVDVTRCTGCGACVDVCPTGAMALVDAKARVDEELCTGCRACADACPEDAIQPVVQGELIPAPERPAPTVYRPSPLAETAGAAVVVAGTRLLVKAASGLARAAGRWLTRRSAVTGPSTGSGTRLAGDRRGTGRQRHGVWHHHSPAEHLVSGPDRCISETGTPTRSRTTAAVPRAYAGYILTERT